MPYKDLEKKRAWMKSHRPQCNAAQKKYRLSHLEKVTEKNRLWAKNNPEKCKLYVKRCRENKKIRGMLMVPCPISKITESKFKDLIDELKKDQVWAKANGYDKRSEELSYIIIKANSLKALYSTVCI
jgi:hypothetical protein